MDFNGLLDYMVEKKASDLFITADVEPSIKINGTILPIGSTKLPGAAVGQLVHSIMSDKQRKEFADTRECNFAIMNKDHTSRFRVSAFQQRDQPGMVLRRIETVIPTMDELKLPPILKELAMTKRGIIIFVTHVIRLYLFNKQKTYYEKTIYNFISNNFINCNIILWW